MTVDVRRDWIDDVLLVVQLLSLLATAWAAWLAFRTIRETKAQARKAQAALLLERRLDFELNVLRELVLAANRLETVKIRAMAIMLPAEDVPVTRASVNLPSTAHAADEIAHLALPRGSHPTIYVEAALDAINEELLRAISARVANRALAPRADQSP